MSENKSKYSCPFCGCDDYRIKLRRQGNKGYRVICGKCGASGPYSPIREWHNNKTIAQNLALSAWNTRKPVDAVLDRLENAAFWTPQTYDEDGFRNDDSEEVVLLNRALAIVKEELNYKENCG